MTATTKPNLDEVVAKIEALLNVKGRTPEESALYVAKAHKLLDKYDLDIDDIGKLKADPRTAVGRGNEVTRTTKGKPDGWKADVLFEVARMFEVRVVRGYDTERTKSGKDRSIRTYSLIGFKHDVEAAHYAHSFLVGEITRLGKEYAKPMWDTIKANAKEWGTSVHTAERYFVEDEGTHPLKAELYFVKGAAQTVGEALARATSEEEDAAEANPNALVVQKKEAIDDFIGREQYGDEWETVKARRAAARAAGGIGDLSAYLEARRREQEAEEAKHANETPAQHARCERRKQREAEAEERRWQKQYERDERKRQRQLEKMDLTALNAGQLAGRRINIRPGIGGGSGQ